MRIQTEPIGSIPRPIELILAIKAHAVGQISDRDLQILYDQAIADTIKKFEATGSPVISDGEQSKPSFATYPIQGMQNLSPDGVIIPFADGHNRQLPKITSGPFKYQVYSDVQMFISKRQDNSLHYR
jgi:5-methyltetrahydropteroyltriglutamate--homocysteine methyltransferase